MTGFPRVGVRVLFLHESLVRRLVGYDGPVALWGALPRGGMRIIGGIQWSIQTDFCSHMVKLLRMSWTDSRWSHVQQFFTGWCVTSLQRTGRLGHPARSRNKLAAEVHISMATCNCKVVRSGMNVVQNQTTNIIPETWPGSDARWSRISHHWFW